MKKCLSLILFLMISLHVSNANAKFHTENLSSNIKAFISKKYQFDTRKKLVIYTFDNAPQCPYGRIFYDAFNQQMNDADLENYYVFQHSINRFSYSSNDTDAEVLSHGFDELADKCGFFCIIDMNGNWFYSIGNAVGEKQAQLLPSLFEELKYK